MTNEIKITPTIKTFLTAVMADADARADADSADVVKELVESLVKASDMLESKATALRESGSKMMALMAECAPESAEVDRLEQEIKGAAATDNDRWAMRMTVVANLLLGSVDGLRPGAEAVINGTIPIDGDSVFAPGRVSGRATASRVGKAFLRITGTDESYYFDPDAEGRWGISAIVGLMHSALRGVRLRYPLRSDAADEEKTGRDGKPNYVQKVGVVGVNLPRILADRFDSRFYLDPLTDANIIEYGRQLADGTDEVILTATMLDAAKCPQGSIEKDTDVAKFVCVAKGTDSKYYPVGRKGSCPTYIADAEAQKNFAAGFALPEVAAELLARVNADENVEMANVDNWDVDVDNDGNDDE